MALGEAAPFGQGQFLGRDTTGCSQQLGKWMHTCMLISNARVTLALPAWLRSWQADMLATVLFVF